MENLNTELTLEILSRLPTDSVLRCTGVCKTWQTLIRHPYFAHIHHRRQLQLLYGGGGRGGGGDKVGMGLLFWIGRFREKMGILQLHYRSNIDDDDDDGQQQRHLYSKILTRIGNFEIQKDRSRNAVVGSCNGLICFSVPHHDVEDPIRIHNPITQEYVDLPRLRENIFEGCMASIASGFGYHPSTNQYKVVRIAYHPEELMMGIVEVYTLGDGRGWRNIGEISYMLSCSLRGIYVNGALHWMDDNDPGKIVAFDLSDEEFRLLPSPPCVPLGEYHDDDDQLFNLLKHYKLSQFGGRLCVIHWDERGENVDIWSLNKEDADYHSWSWTREFSIARRGLYMNEYQPFQPFALTENGEILLGSSLKILSLYDPKTATITKNLVDDDKGLTFFEAIPHVNSFVSLRALGEKSTTIIRKSKRVMQRALLGEKYRTIGCTRVMQRAVLGEKSRAIRKSRSRIMHAKIQGWNS
ncbi:F-box domain [Macleaya cordata]|uniref:F-box domain n=1 Tax=Macleaya cordata TaxID=56857 RepID=A0A200PQJ4_MACCD|nr:F-box domain [Macleaya cordata]